MRWATSSGRARVYSYSVVRQNDAAMFRDRVPYVAAIVELAEGPRMMTNLVDVEPSDVRIGMAGDRRFRSRGRGWCVVHSGLSSRCFVNGTRVTASVTCGNGETESIPVTLGK